MGFRILPKIFYFYILKPLGRLKTSTAIFIVDFNNTVGIFCAKRRPTRGVFYLRFIFLLAPNCKVLKFLWVKMRTKIFLNCRFFVITLSLQFKNSKCFRSSIMINKENSTVLEQFNCRYPGSNQEPLDLQSNALPTELSRLEKLTTDFRQVFQFLPKIFYFYIIKPHGRLKTSTVIFILGFNKTAGIFCAKNRRPTRSVFLYVLYFSSRLIVNY